jgi:hypothetical protein
MKSMLFEGVCQETMAAMLVDGPMIKAQVNHFKEHL